MASASALADEIAKKPLVAKTIVLPDHRGTAQREELKDLLPDSTVLMVEDVNRTADAGSPALARPLRTGTSQVLSAE
jgi:hypothetical protein